MRKLALPLALAAVAAALGACSTPEPATPAPAPAVVLAPAPAQVVVAPAPGTVVAPGTIVTAPTATVVQPTAMLTGFGRVETITPLASAAAGSSGRATRRLGLRMDNGTVQYVDTPAELSVGDRIEITSDGYIKRS